MTEKKDDFTSEEVLDVYEYTKECFKNAKDKSTNAETAYIMRELLKDDIIAPNKKSIEDYFKDKNK